MLPATFRFSQSSLQDFVDCPRRFQLRYVESQAWPGVQSEPLLDHERHLERGTAFHRLVERHQLGMDAEVLGSGIGDPELLAWWRAYLDFGFLHDLRGRRYPEYTLSAWLGDALLAATFDLLVVVLGERVVIFDWKTYARSPGREWLVSRLQTRVYPYVVCVGVHRRVDSAGAGWMAYWFAGAPGDPFFVEYGAAEFERDRAYLVDLVARVDRGFGGVWPLTEDQRRCRFCEYRSLCGRGVGAGGYLELEGEFEEFRALFWVWLMLRGRFR
jgi:hypothetical protein